MNYALGFANGERRAFLQRRRARRQPKKYPGTRPAVIRNEFHRGFWDGYEARTPEWKESHAQ